MKLKSLTSALKDSSTEKLKWTAEMDQEFRNIKDEIKNIKPLAIPNYEEMFLLRTDASNNGVGAVLMQKKKENGYQSNGHQKKFTPTESMWKFQKRRCSGSSLE